MGFLESRKEAEELEKELLAKNYGIERPGLEEMYLDFLDFALTGGMAQIARKTAKRNVLESLKEFWQGKPGRESWKNVKKQFEPISKALDELPQSELDYLKDIRTERKFDELSEISPGFKGLLFGTYSPAEERIILNSMLGPEEAGGVLFHEMGHAGTLGKASAKRKIGTKTAVRLADEIRYWKGLGYTEDPLEFYANKFSEGFEGLKGSKLTRNERLTEAHSMATEETMKYLDAYYPEELGEILDRLGGGK